MNYTHSMQVERGAHASPILLELESVLNTIDASVLLARLQAYRPPGRPGYPLVSLWCAYVASFVLNLPSTNALIRRLQDDAQLRLLCGFNELPP